MADNTMEDLLQEALADFDELAPSSNVTSNDQVLGRNAASPTAPTDTKSTETVATSVESEPCPASPAVAQQQPTPKGLGLGLGTADPLGRRSRKPAAGVLASSGGEASTSVQESQACSASVTDSNPNKGGRKLPAEAQSLADDLMGLLQEAGFGGEASAGPSDANDLTACLANLMAAGEKGGLEASAPGASREHAGPASSAAGGPGDDDPFAQLFGRMMGGLVPPGGVPGGGGPGGDEVGAPPELAAMLQQMMGGVGMAAVGGPAATAAGAAGPSGFGAGGDDDDDALASSRLAGLAKQTKKTVSKQAKKTRGHVEGAQGGCGGPATGAAAGLFGGGGGADGLGALLRELGGLGQGGGEGAQAGGVNMMVDYIMQNLLSKDVLYGPLKEIRDRYPPWLEANQGKLPGDDYRRYVAQYESVQRVCAHYETAPSDFAKLMELIQEMQTYGDPPGDIVEEMTGGAGRDLNSLLSAADAEPTSAAVGQPAHEDMSSELEKCKMQ